MLLVQRAADASLMAGMWELPPVLSPENLDGSAPVLRVRHSITDTDYRVSVFAVDAHQFGGANPTAQWFTPKQCQRLALTGLTRKILRKIAHESKRKPAESKR